MATSKNSPTNRPPIEVLPLAALRAESAAEREYLYTLTPPPEPLRRSIAARGVLTPLVLAPDGKLVSGARRLAAARACGHTELPIVRAENAREAFLAGVWENVAHRQLAPLELAALFGRLECIAGLTCATIAADYLPACGLEASPIVLAKYLALAALPPALTALPLRESHLFLVAECAPEDAAALARIFAAAQPSAGEARALRDLLAEIAVRERTSIAAAASSPELAAILAADTPPRLKVPALRSTLGRRAFPGLSALERSAKDAAARGGLAGPIEVRLPPDLEGDALELRVRVKSEADAARAAEALASARGRVAIAAILAILRGERE